jgi:hypothetical protein
MAVIKVCVRGYAPTGPARYRGEVVASREIVWVEIDGIRIDGNQLISVGGNWGGQGFHTTEINLVGTPEFVYLGRDDEELS